MSSVLDQPIFNDQMGLLSDGAMYAGKLPRTNDSASGER